MSVGEEQWLMLLEKDMRNHLEKKQWVAKEHLTAVSGNEPTWKWHQLSFTRAMKQER